MIKAVIFDVGGVLLKWPREIVFNDIKSELDLDDEAMEAFWNRYLRAFSKGEYTEAELWAKARTELGIRLVKIEENLLGRAFAKNTEAYKEVVEYARELKNRGLKIAILSNTNSVHTLITEQHKVFEPFDDVFLSHEIGLRKPETAIYKHVLNQLKIKPEETIFIDDTLENIQATRRLGMHTVLARNPKTLVAEIERVLA